MDAGEGGTQAPERVAELTEQVKTVFHREVSDGLYFGRAGVDQCTDSEGSLAARVERYIVRAVCPFSLIYATL